MSRRSRSRLSSSAEASAEAPALEEVLAENPVTTDAQAETPVEAVVAEPAVPAEPEFDEVWSPAGRRPDHKRHEHRRRPEGEGQQARSERQRPPAKRRPEGEVQDFSKARHLNPKLKFDGKGRNDNRRPDSEKGERARFERPREEKREKAFDPDSPFAKLAALRDRKAE